MTKNTWRKRIKSAFRIILIKLLQLLKLIRSQPELFLHFLPARISEEIKNKIRSLLDEEISGHEKQKIVVDWIIKDVMKAVPPNTWAGKIYWNLSDEAKRLLINAVVTNLRSMIEERIDLQNITKNLESA